MRAIAAMFLDLLMEMLAALLADWETPHSLCRIAQELAQSTAVLALAAEFGVACPVLRRLDGLGRRRTQLRNAMLQEPGGRRLRRGDLREPLVNGLHVGNEHLVKVVMSPVREHVSQEPIQVLGGRNRGENADNACHNAGALFVVTIPGDGPPAIPALNDWWQLIGEGCADGTAFFRQRRRIAAEGFADRHDLVESRGMIPPASAGRRNPGGRVAKGSPAETLAQPVEGLAFGAVEVLRETSRRKRCTRSASPMRFEQFQQSRRVRGIAADDSLPRFPVADDFLGEGAAGCQCGGFLAAARHLFERGNGRRLALAGQDAKVVVAGPDHEDALTIPALHETPSLPVAS